MSEHHVFTGSAGADRSSSAGWSHTVPDALPLIGGEPARYVAHRSESDRWHPAVWFALTVVCLLVLAAISKVTLAALLSWMGYL